MKSLIAFLGFILMFSLAESHLNLYLNEHETMKLLGLSAQIYYVRDGHVNEYALHFTVPVPANVKDITFNWQSLAKRPLPYRIELESSDPIALPRPLMNISRIGDIPTTDQIFSIALRCSGLRAAEVEVTITIQVTLNRVTNNVTELVFKRNKICLLGENELHEQSVDPIPIGSMADPPDSLITLIVGIIGASFLVALLVSLACCAREKVKRQPNLSQPIRTSSFQRLQTHSSSQVITACPPITLPKVKPVPDVMEELQRRITEMTVQRCRVRLSSLLQEGTFGRVYRGTYNDNKDVLVKTVSHANSAQIQILLQESMNLYGISHPGILSVLGVSIEDNTTPIVLYSGENGTRNLKLFLLEPTARTLTTIQIVKMSFELAAAIGHLHNYGIIHKDIAARNCVVDDQLNVKLSDNSLARDLFPQDYCCLGDRENRPIKWMSLEALNRNLFVKFSEASDAWSFGVLLWELFTLAKQPYQDVDAFEMEAYLRDGYRLAQPHFCPDELFNMMAYCWAENTEERPTFSQLKNYLQEFYNQLTKYV